VLPVASVLASQLITSLAAHPWAFNFFAELLTLQPIDELRKALSARLKARRMGRSNPDFWASLIAPENHFSKKDFGKTKLRHLELTDFVQTELLIRRKPLCNLIVDLLGEALAGLDGKIKNYRQFVIAPFMTLAMGIRTSWQKSPELREKLHNIILSAPVQFLRLSHRDFLIGPSFNPKHIILDDQVFPLRLFLATKLIKTDEILEKLLPIVFKADMAESPKDQKVINALFSAKITAPGPRLLHR
jgi:hypothetical protein